MKVKMSGENFSQVRAEDLIFGRLVIQRQLASKDLVTTLLRQQKEQSDQGQVVRLSKLLQNKGKISPQQIQELERIQRKNFMICSGCFTQFNIEAFEDGKKFKCKSCSKILMVDRAAQAPAPPAAPQAFTFEQVQEYLCIDSKELGLVIASGELKGFLDGAVMKFKLEDVDRVKKSKEVQPTLILDPKTSVPVKHHEDMGDSLDIDEEIPMREVLDILQIDESQLRKLMALGELIPNYKEDGEAWFPKEVVLRIKQSREAQPTMILSDVSLDKSAGEQLISFEEAMEDLQVDAGTLRDWIAQKNVHPIARGDNSFFKTSDIAKLRSTMRERKKETREHKLSTQSYSPPGHLLTFEEVLEVLKIEPKALRQLVVSKKLKGTTADGIIKFHPEDVEKFKQQSLEGSEEPSFSGTQNIPLLKDIPSGPVQNWKQDPKFQQLVEDFLSLPNLPSAAFGIANPDSSVYPITDVLFVEPLDSGEAFDFQSFFLVQNKTSGGSLKVRKVGKAGDFWVLMGNSDSTPEVFSQGQIEVLGKVSGRFSVAV